jgi:hypothetical protein
MTLRIVAQRVALISLVLAAMAMAQQPPESSPRVELVQGTLVAPGSPPFHLKAQISEGGGQPQTFIELFWQAPNRLRRTIQSDQFEQTLIVNGNDVFEHDSPMYMPPEIQTLLTAMVDPLPIIASLKPGDAVRTKANGASQESGVTCFDPAHRMCTQTAFGLMETVGAEGSAVDFTNYRIFHGKRIARRLTHTISVGDFYTAEVTQLDDLKNADEELFAITEPTPPEKRLRVEVLGEPELRGLLSNASEIIWPQVLDGAVSGQASFYISLDTEGKVREVLPLKTANERSNDSAIRQIMRWKFNPAIRNGVPVQAEGTLHFAVDTRAAGPREALSDADARKLASNIVEPVVPAGSVAPGTLYKLWIAVDSDGIVIEKIIADAPPGLFGPVDKALKQWRFKPLMVDGKPQPYRALLELHLQPGS